MLAILSAITEVIKERNGTQSSAEFFLGLVSVKQNSQRTYENLFEQKILLQMETLEAIKEEKDVIATLSLLTMVMKSVPHPVLRKKFAEVGDIFQQLLEQFADSENQNVMRSVNKIFPQTTKVSQTVFILDYWMYLRTAKSSRIYIMVSRFNTKIVQSSVVIRHTHKTKHKKGCSTCYCVNHSRKLFHVYTNGCH